MVAEKGLDTRVMGDFVAMLGDVLSKSGLEEFFNKGTEKMSLLGLLVLFS